MENNITQQTKPKINVQYTYHFSMMYQTPYLGPRTVEDQVIFSEEVTSMNLAIFRRACRAKLERKNGHEVVDPVLLGFTRMRWM